MQRINQQERTKVWDERNERVEKGSDLSVEVTNVSGGILVPLCSVLP